MAKQAKSKLPDDWKEQLRNPEPEEIEKDLGSGTGELKAIPLGMRTNYTVYLESRQYVALQSVVNKTGVSLQDLMREGAKLILNKYNRKK